MPSRSPSNSPRRRDSDSQSRSPTPARSRSPRRSISPRSASRSPVRNGTRDRSYSRSPSRGRSVSRSRSRNRSPRQRSPPKSAKIVVEKLTKNVNDEHLKEVFGIYGPLKEVDMPMNKQFMTNRGTAYILYEDTADAEAAIAHMHEAQLDGAVIHVSIVLPKRRFSKPPPLSRRVEDFEHSQREMREMARGPPPPVRDFRGPPPGRFRSPPRRRESPPLRGYRDRASSAGRDRNTYRPHSYSRSRSPVRRRSRSRSYSSRSRSPSRTPPRRGGAGGDRSRDYRRRESPPRGGGGGGRRRRSPSYSSYDSRSRSRSRGGQRR